MWGRLGASLNVETSIDPDLLINPHVWTAHVQVLVMKTLIANEGRWLAGKLGRSFLTKLVWIEGRRLT